MHEAVVDDLDNQSGADRSFHKGPLFFAAAGYAEGAQATQGLPFKFAEGVMKLIW